MQCQTLVTIQMEIGGVHRSFDAIKVFTGGGDFGLPDKGYAFRMVATGYAGAYIPVYDRAAAFKAVRVLAAEFVDIMLSIAKEEEDK